MDDKKLIVMPATGEGCTESVFMELFTCVEFYDTLIDPKDYKMDKNTVVLFQGGRDINPSYYGEVMGEHTQPPNITRDRIEFSMFYRAVKSGAGMIGICRGAQLITAAAGGKLIQHVTGHRGLHPISTFDNRTLICSSDHHQMMNPYPINKDSWDMIAWSRTRMSKNYLSGDGSCADLPKDFMEPEIVWYPSYRALAIQGHPEWMRDDLPFPCYCRKLVSEFIFKEMWQDGK